MDVTLWLRFICLLYLSAFPEDYVIPKVPLVWMWVAEGFVQKQNGKGLFKTGEGYFNDLINRSLIHDVDGYYIPGCCVHDMVLDFIRSVSCEENFFTVFVNNDLGTVVQSNVVRRLAHHNNSKTMVLSNQASIFDMSKVRSFIAHEWAIDTWTWRAPISSFKLLRVLNITYYYIHFAVEIEQLGHLLHLRFLSIYGRGIEKIPGEIGSLKMLQTLDLMSPVLELPSHNSLPTQLVCLRIQFYSKARDAEMFSVGRLTSLEELSIEFNFFNKHVPRRLVKELGSLRELRVLDAQFPMKGEEMLRDLMEFVCHLHKLLHLRIRAHMCPTFERQPEKEFVLPGDLRYLVLSEVVLWKLPSCIHPLCHRKLSHLDLCLLYMDEEELKILGRLPVLHFLKLKLYRSSPTVCNISDSDACYFPKLRCLRLPDLMVFFLANKLVDDKKTVSFYIWNAVVDSTPSLIPPVSVAELPEMDTGPVGEKSDEELELLSISDGGHPSRASFQSSKLQHGIAIPPVSDEEKKESSISTIEGDGKVTALPRFMPCLEELHFEVPKKAILNPRYFDNLGLEFLCSLRKISADIDVTWRSCRIEMEVVEAVLRRAAQVHPNHPTLDINKS